MTDTDPLKWFSETAGRRVTVTGVGEILSVSRNTARSRLDSLSSDDIIDISRGLGINPARALEELGKLSADEIFGYLDGGGTLLAAASPDELLYRLAEESLPVSSRIRLGASASVIADQDELAARRADSNGLVSPAPASRPSREHDGTVRRWDDSVPHAADSSIDEQEARDKEGSDPID